MNSEIYIKSILKYLQQTNVSTYIATTQQKKLLEYPQRNQENTLFVHSQLVALDCEMIQTSIGPQICQVLIINHKDQILYQQWFKPKHQVVDYITHITGLTQQKLFSKDLKEFNQASLEQIQHIIQGKIIVGHDLANDLRVLPINHNLFIDTVALYPHNFGLPFKNKLKYLALQYLNRPIQWHTHNSKEDAKAALDLAVLHITEGRGIMVDIQAEIPQNHYTINQLIQQAQLQIDRIDGLFLRGSRALQLQVEEKQYVSDWDYFCIYSTTSTINGKLIKLYNTDITIYDTKTFNRLLRDNNDLPLVELFFLPIKYQYINKLQLPHLQIGIIRESLGFHLGKCQRKIKRFKKELQGPKMEWKILKTYHLQLRFLDYFMQIHQSNSIFDVKKTKRQWDQLKQIYLNTNSFVQAQKQAKQRIKIAHQEVRKVHRSHRPLKNLSEKTQQYKYSPQLQNSGKLQCFAHDQIYLLLKKYVKNYIPSSLNPHKLALIDQLLQHSLSRIDQYRIGFNRHKIYPNLIQFHYLQSANFQNQICRQSRGIILDQSRNYQIVSLPYFKFFDYNDSKFTELHKFDFTSCQAYQKYDGSIAVLYYYKGNWQVSSSRIPDGSNNYCFARPQTTTEFKIQFWKIFYKLAYKIPSYQDVDLTFIFQILSKDHIIVVRRQESNLILHGVINRKTAKQLNHQQYSLKYGWNFSRQIENKIHSIQQAVKYVQNLNPFKQQGLILRDKNNIRIKVKSVGYIRANWLAELNLTPLKDPKKYLLTQVILSGDSQTFCSYCPQWKPLIDEVLRKIDYLNSQCTKIYEKVKDMSRKQISHCVGKQRKQLQPFIFALVDNYKKWHNKLQFFLNPKRLNQYLERIPSQQIMNQ